MDDVRRNPDAVGTETHLADPHVNGTGIDPTGMLRPKMRVIGEAGRTLGRVSSAERDAVSGFLNSLVVRHGLFGRTHTVVLAERVAQVNPRSVMLQMSLNDFLALPTIEGR